MTCKGLLEAYSPEDPQQEEYRSRMLALLQGHRDCFERSCLPAHFTASAFVVSDDLEQVLLLFHAKLKRWLQPGGHADGDRDLGRVAVKELREETGLRRNCPMELFDLDIHIIPENSFEPAHEHFDLRFLFFACPSQKLTQNNESTAIQWFPIRRLGLIDTDESVRRMAVKASGYSVAA